MRFFYTLSIILLLSIPAFSQNKSPNPPTEPVARIVKFYPNPATSFITFDIQKESNKNYTFQIFNLLGKKVYEATNLNPRTIINLSDFFRGVYIFQLKDKGGKLLDSGKFQVSK